MSDYIKREDAIQANIAQVEFCKSEGLDFSGKLHIDSIINNLKHIPAANVVEQKTGQWITRTADAIEELYLSGNNLVAVVDDMAEDLKKFRWIPVTERLPEDGVEVLVWSQFGFAYVDLWIDGAWKIDGLVNGENEAVTHWMPLPEPPEEKP